MKIRMSLGTLTTYIYIYIYIYRLDSHMAPYGACGVEHSEVRSSEVISNSNEASCCRKSMFE